MIGERVPRTDGVAKVTGVARYVDDVPRLPGELFGVTIRSPVARGVLRGLRIAEGTDLAGVTIVTGEDLAPLGSARGDRLANNVVALIVDDQPILADREVHHVGEPVALLACEDRARAEALRRAIEPVIDPLPAVFGIDGDLAGREVQKRYRIAHGDARAALAGCDVVVSGRYRVHHQEQLYIEPQGCVARWQGDVVEVLGSLQCPYYVHKALKRAFDLDDTAAIVEQAVTGGGFGGKEEYPSVIALHAALLARKSGRPVRMIYGRAEDIEATTKRHPAICTVTIGASRDGTFRAIAVDVVMDGGAYVTLTPVVLSRGALHACGAYRFDAHLVEAVAVATNTPPNGAFRGFGAPQTIFAVERHVDVVARVLGLDPAELRRKNLFVVGDETCTGQILDLSVGGMECLEAATARARWAERRAEIEASNRDARRRGSRLRRGIGISTFMHGAGFTGSGERRLKGKVAVDLAPGGRLLVRTASTDIGQGTETVFRQIAADAAGVPFDAIDFEIPSTAKVPDSGPTVASRTVMVVGSIVGAAAREVATRVRDAARPGEDFATAGDRLLAKAPVTSLQQYEPPVTKTFDEETYTGDAYPVFSWACDIAEIEIDLDTYEVRVEKLWTAHDVGRAIHPVLCAGQVEGGTLQAIGWALHEDVVFRADGSIANGRMTNYIVPTALDAPPFETILVEVPYPHGPGGAKGVGEIPMDGGAPCIAAAIEHALEGDVAWSEGSALLPDLPLLPERIYERVVRARGAA